MKWINAAYDFMPGHDRCDPILVKIKILLDEDEGIDCGCVPQIMLVDVIARAHRIYTPRIQLPLSHAKIVENDHCEHDCDFKDEKFEEVNEKIIKKIKSMHYTKQDIHSWIVLNEIEPITEV